MLFFLKEIPENGADISHLAHLHTPGFASGVDLRYTNSKTWEFLRHDWKVRIEHISFGFGVVESVQYMPVCTCCICMCVCGVGSMGTRVGAQQALFSDVCETCFNGVWIPLASAGCSRCSQTGNTKYKFYQYNITAHICKVSAQKYVFNWLLKFDEN